VERIAFVWSRIGHEIIPEGEGRNRCGSAVVGRKQAQGLWYRCSGGGRRETVVEWAYRKEGPLALSREFRKRGKGVETSFRGSLSWELKQ